MSERLILHARRTAEAINLLLKGGHTESALILLYSWIDRMAWSSVEKEESNGRDFKNWVEKFLMADVDLPCTSDELWAARCALLHTGSSESRDTSKNKVRKLHYYGGDINALATSNQKDTVFIRISDLHVGFIGAIGRFNEYLNNNPHEKEIAERKLGKILARTENI